MSKWAVVSRCAPAVIFDTKVEALDYLYDIEFGTPKSFEYDGEMRVVEIPEEESEE